MKNWWLYVLELEDEKYYVGITSQTPEKRLKEHKRGIRAAYWTQEYKPLKILHSQELGVLSKEDAEKIEQKYVRKYMKQFGLNNVRGGDLTKTTQYVQLFGYIYDKENIKIIAVILFLLIVIGFYMVREHLDKI